MYKCKTDLAPSRRGRDSVFVQCVQVLRERGNVNLFVHCVNELFSVYIREKGQLELSNIISSKQLYYGLIAAARKASPCSSRDVLYCDW